MVAIPDDLDAALAEFQRREHLLSAKVAEMKAEQFAGRTGLTSYLEAQSMQAELNGYAVQLRDRMQQILREL